MAVLVLGGAGYIGSHAVRQLIERGERVVVADNLQSGHKDAVQQQAVFYEGDIRDENFLQNILQNEQVDAVIHFAANSLVGESMEQPLAYYDNNVFGMQRVLEAMVAHGVKHIVFSSTAATYGEPEQVPITEEMPTNPTNPYGETKLAMEKMIHWAEAAHDLKYVALRYFNVAGATPSGVIGEDHDPETHLIPIVLQVALGKREFITIFGDDYPTDDGTCIRDYIHVEDLIDAHIRAVQYLRDGGKSQIFNLGSSTGFSVKEIIDVARQVTGHPIPEKIGQRRAGDPSTLIASSEKAARILNWEPKRTEINRIITDAWRWHQNNPKGYQEEVE